MQHRRTLQEWWMIGANGESQGISCCQRDMMIINIYIYIYIVYDVLSTPVNFHAWVLTSEGAELVVKLPASNIFSLDVSTLWEATLGDITKSRRFLLRLFFARKNMPKPLLLVGCTDWLAATDLKHNFIFPMGIALTTKCPDIIIWSVKAKKFSLLS